MLTLFLCGDVMTGRGVDQIMACPSVPEIHERHARDARDYVALAEQASGRIPRGAGPAYVWGDALDQLERARPDARIINLETSVTRDERHWPDKGINYRMHPANVSCLAAARVDACALANNHVLDYCRPGLAETLHTLHHAGVRTAGAGTTLADARRPAILHLRGGRRVILFSFATHSSGVPDDWAATPEGAGVDLIDASDAAADEICDRVARVVRPGDLVVASIHWGGNWGWEVPNAHVRFAHRLLDANVHAVHGHSSHHPLGIEVYRRRLVLYGCGDFIDDYEGIGGCEAFRSHLVLMYFPSFDAGRELSALRLSPMRIRRMRVNRASGNEAAWLEDTVNRVSAPFGCAVARQPDGMLMLVRQV